MKERKKMWKIHAIAVVGFIVLGVLALGSAATQPAQQQHIEPFVEGVAVGDFEWLPLPHVADNNGTRLVRYIGTVRDVQIPAQAEGRSVTEIGPGAFNFGVHLTSVTIPDSVIHIGSGAFANNRLMHVTIPNGVVSIQDYAFDMNILTSITIPNSVIHIGSGAFANNPTLTSVTIGNGLGFLSEDVFSGGSLRHVTHISIGANVRLHSTDPSNLVWSGFRAAYEANGRRAGIYTLNPNTGLWAWIPR